MCRSRWRLVDLAQVIPSFANYTLAGISLALKRLKVRRKRGRLSIHSPDLAYQSKMSWVERACALARQASERVSILYGDEFSLYRQPTLGPLYAQAGQEPKAGLSQRANTRHRISGALDLLSGKVTFTEGAKMGVAGLRRSLERLREVYCQRTIILIWDNWPIHYHPQVLAKAAELGIEILWLPTYAPWTNYIEKLWRWVKNKLLHHHRLADKWRELKMRVTEFLAEFANGSTELLRYVGALPD